MKLIEHVLPSHPSNYILGSNNCGWGIVLQKYRNLKLKVDALFWIFCTFGITYLQLAKQANITYSDYDYDVCECNGLECCISELVLILVWHFVFQWKWHCGIVNSCGHCISLPSSFGIQFAQTAWYSNDLLCISIVTLV